LETPGLERPSNGPCRLYWELCDRTSWARRAYWEAAARRLGIPGHAEALAAWEAAVRSDSGRACRLLAWLFENVPGSRVCILGPRARRPPRGCDIIFSVQAPDVFGIDAVFTDLDSLPPPLDIRASAKWLLVHVHADNWTRVLNYGLEAVYTSQAYCIPPVLGIGGFTDGDRPVALAASLRASEIVLEGYSTSPYCLHKRVCDMAAKRLKLTIAWEIIGRTTRLGYIIERLGETIRLKLGPSIEDLGERVW